MHPSLLSVLALDAFPTPSSIGKGIYLDRLQHHVQAFPHVNVPHAHHFYLLLFITQGSGTHTIDLIPYPVQPGCLFLMAPGQAHHWVLSDDVQGYVLFFSAEFYLTRFPAERLVEYPFFLPGFSQVIPLPGNDDQIIPLLHRLWQEYQAAQPFGTEVIRATLFLCLETAARYYPVESNPHSPANQRHLREFSQRLNQHFRTHHAVHDYANFLGLTPNHLNAICREVLHQTARELIHERIIAEAARQLTLTSLPVHEIAETLGFEDSSYFSRFFKKHTGQRPEAFRKNR